MQLSKLNWKRLVPLVVITAVVAVVLVFAGPAIYAAWLADQNEDYWKPHLRPPVADPSTIPVYTDPEVRDQLGSLFLYDPLYCGGDRGIYSKVDSRLLRKLQARGRKDNGDLLLALGDPLGAVRAGAAHVLGTLGDDSPAVLNGLVDACQPGWGDRRGNVGYETFHAFRALAPEASGEFNAWVKGDLNFDYQFPLFTERLARLREWQEELRQDWHVAENRTGVLETLLQTIDRDFSIKHRAASEVLAGFGPEAEPGAEVLIGALTLGDGPGRYRVQREAGVLLTRIGEPVVDRLMATLPEADIATAGAILKTLAGMKGIDTADRLLAVLPEADDETAGVILETLADMEGIDTLPYLDELLPYMLGPPGNARDQATRLIAGTGPALIPRIAHLLDSDDGDTIKYACDLLCDFNANAGRDPDDYVETVELNKLAPRLMEIAHSDDLHLAAQAIYLLQYSYPMDPAIPRSLAANMAARRGSGQDGVGWLTACTMVALPRMRPLPDDVVAHLEAAGPCPESAEEQWLYLRDFQAMGADAERVLPYIREIAETDPSPNIRKLAAETARSIEIAVNRKRNMQGH